MGELHSTSHTVVRVRMACCGLHLWEPYKPVSRIGLGRMGPRWNTIYDGNVLACCISHGSFFADVPTADFRHTSRFDLGVLERIKSICGLQGFQSTAGNDALDYDVHRNYFGTPSIFERCGFR